MVIVIAHRGASADFPENTVEAFKGARNQGADWVELDARPTADGAIVVAHDSAMSDGRHIADLTLREIGESLPTLSEALEACVPMAVNVEIKHFATEPGFSEDRRVVDLVLEVCAGAANQLLVTSFDLAVVDRVKQLDARMPTGFLVLDPTTPVDGELDAVGVAAARGHDALNPVDQATAAATVERCHQAGLEINVWTVDDMDRAAELAGWGVDGIITNTPGRLRESLAGGGAGG